MPRHVLVVCKGDAQLVALDPATLEERWRVGLSDIGHEVTASPADRLAFVPLYGTGGVGHPGRSGDGIDVIDINRGHKLGTIPLPLGSRPHFAAWGRDRILHVTAEGMASVLSVDVPAWLRSRTDQVRAVDRLSTGHEQTHMLAVAPGGGRIYTADVSPGRVTEVDVGSRDRRSLPLADRINRISLSPDGRTAFVADQDSPRLAAVDLRSMELERWIPLPHIAFGTAAAGHDRLVVAFRHAGLLGLLNTATGEVLSTVAVPEGPQRIVVSGDGRAAYATCSPADVVVRVDLATMDLTAAGTPGADPDGLDVVSYRFPRSGEEATLRRSQSRNEPSSLRHNL